MLAINNNLAAAQTANTLGGHYGRLSTSVERLSTGLRINGAADDAAGLAIRELMRADVAALNQGKRNINDAISMLQTMDGALGVIDEKLIRMKELAEQAATGTYDSTQRLMIDSEFQAMGAEINRIARSTDFNGVKLLDGAFETPATEVVGPDGKTYDVAVNGSWVSIPPGGVGNRYAWSNVANGITDPGSLGVGTHTLTLTNDNIVTIGGKVLTVRAGAFTPTDGDAIVFEYDTARFAATDGWRVSVNGANWTPSLNRTGTQLTVLGPGANSFIVGFANPDGTTASSDDLTSPVPPVTWNVKDDPSFTSSMGTITNLDDSGGSITFDVDLGNGNTISQAFTGADPRTFANATINITVRDTTPQPDAPAEPDKIPDNVVKIHFGTGNDSAEDYYYINKQDCTLKGLGLEGVSIQTQDTAQKALGTINDAIIKKDKARAYFGAMQNRLENTMTNNTIQAENLQAAESRLSDADIAAEMTTFVRNQILTQSAVAMLAQANSMPQMAMQLLR